MLCVHNGGMGSFVLHELILCASEGFLSELLGVHNEGMGTFDLHGLILSVSVGFLSELLETVTT